MERMYRETVLRKKRFRQKVLAGSLFLWIMVQICQNISGEMLQKIMASGTNCMQPAIISYQTAPPKVTNTPWMVRLFAPDIFAYTWKEEVPVFSIIELNREEIFLFEVSEEEALSLLQENLYVEGKEIFAEAVTSEIFTSDIEQIVQPEKKEKDFALDFNQYADVSKLIKDFYVVDASTSPDTALLDVQKLANYDCSIDKEDAKPQILIYHSHSQEAFADSIPGDEGTTIVGAGEKLSGLLEEQYGYEVLHHTGVYDYPSRDNAYSNALPAVEQLLKENPSIQVVIDLHRDAVAEGTKLVTTIDGKDYARFMFFNGICRSTDGPITYLNNPYLQENLAFSFQAQRIAEHYFPGITRKIYLKAWRYNMHFKPRNMLIELGAQTNTVEEIMNTTEILAFVINEVLSRQ